MGDAGSMKLGLLLAFFLIEASQKPNSENALPASMLPWLVALPIMDAVSVMFFRWYKNVQSWLATAHICIIALSMRAGLGEKPYC